MKEYKVTFRFKNGIEGEATLRSTDSKSVYLKVCEMFAYSDPEEWEIKEA